MKEAKNRKLPHAKPIGKRLLSDRFFRALMFACGSMGWNLIYGVFNGALGIVYRSVWFATMGAYYLMLGGMRLSVVTLRMGSPKRRTEHGTATRCGVAMIFLAAILALSVGLSFLFPVARAHNKIIMITIAAYTVFMTFLAVRNIVRARQGKSLWILTLRNFSLAAATASVLSLERSLLTTFGEGTSGAAYVLEVISGAAAFAVVLSLGIGMILRGRGRFGSPSDAAPDDESPEDGAPDA